MGKFHEKYIHLNDCVELMWILTLGYGAVTFFICVDFV